MEQILDKQDRIGFTNEFFRTTGDFGAYGRELRDENVRLLRFLIPEGVSILDIGCGTGEVLAALRPGRGVGVDYSSAALGIARAAHPDLEFIEADAEEPFEAGGTFDVVLINLAVGEFLDVWKVFRNMRAFCSAETRIIITYFNFIWYPALELAVKLGMRRQSLPQNWLSLYDIESLLRLNGFEIIHAGTRTLCPLPIPVVSDILNRFAAKLPLLRHLNVLTYCAARLIPSEIGRNPGDRSVSIIIPTRNERGNIEGAVERTPDMGSHTELIFVDGDSSDGTVEEIERMIELHRGKRDISLIHQVPPGESEGGTRMLRLGKGDAVRKGFNAAKGEILMILDSDLTVPPEDLPKFYHAINEGRAEFINGNRLSYPMEDQAMRFLNLVANRMFGIIFTWLLDQPVKDTLCGTKVLTADAWEKISANREYFGDFDPFGDFDLLFGAAKLNLRITDLPVRYRARTYGDIKIERFKHGLILLRMCGFAFTRIKLQ